MNHEVSVILWCPLTTKHNRKPVIYRGPDSVGLLLDQLKKETEWIENAKSVTQPVTMHQVDQEKLMQQAHCHICDRQLGTDKCLDHCHLIRRVRGYPCNACNLHFKYQVTFLCSFTISLTLMLI